MSSPTWYTRRPRDEVVALEAQTLAAPRFDIYVGHTTMAAMLFQRNGDFQSHRAVKPARVPR